MIGGRPVGAVGPAAAAGRIGQAAVVGTEVVPPLRDAVRLVHGEARQRAAPTRSPGERFGREALGRDVEEAELSIPRARRWPRAAPPARRASGARPPRMPLRFKLVHLVLHEGDERRDDERQARQDHGRELIAERLSGAGRHDGENVPAGEHRAHESPPGPGRKAGARSEPGDGRQGDRRTWSD